MSKVIVERPRRGGGYGREFMRERADLESLPTREPLRDRRARTKALNENLAPLYRFLHKQVGRSWNKVRSEMRAHISPKSAVQKHVLDHVKTYVEENVVLVNGVPSASGYGGVRPLRKGDLYVHPKTGIVCVAREVKKVAPKLIPSKRFDATHVAIYLKGCWHEATMKSIIPMAGAPLLRDAVLEHAWDDALVALYGKWKGQVQYAVSVRPMRRNEIRMLP
jgi:hypothetical protein